MIAVGVCAGAARLLTACRRRRRSCDRRRPAPSAAGRHRVARPGPAVSAPPSTAGRATRPAARRRVRGETCSSSRTATPSSAAQLPDGDRARRPAVRDAAADHRGAAHGDGLQAGHRPRRRAGRRPPAGDRPVVAARRSLGIPYEDGLWSGTVRIERPPAAGAGNVLGQSAATRRATRSTAPAAADPAACAPASRDGRAADTGPRATLLPDGLAAAPAAAPPAVREIIAAGNQIVGRPYVYGGAHGLPLSDRAGLRLLEQRRAPALRRAACCRSTTTPPRGTLESWGLPGPGAG